MTTMVETLSRVSTAAYQAASASAEAEGSVGGEGGAPKGDSDSGPADGDETVEGEFKEV
jgi:hypothetical protein